MYEHKQRKSLTLSNVFHIIKDISCYLLQYFYGLSLNTIVSLEYVFLISYKIVTNKHVKKEHKT